MSSINQLSEAGSFSPGMLIPVYDGANGQPRALVGQSVLDYIAANPATPSAPIPLPAYSVAELALLLPASYAQRVVYCTNGNAGAACLAVSDGTNWLRVALGAAVSAT